MKFEAVTEGSFGIQARVVTQRSYFGNDDNRSFRNASHYQIPWRNNPQDSKQRDKNRTFKGV